MDAIYLDNASTSFPKPAAVPRAMARFVTDIGCNVARGGYAPAFEAAEVVWETRERLCALLGGPDPRNVIFTANVTAALNMALKGLLRPGDHVLVSSVEHNAVMRPLHQLAQGGVTVGRIPTGGGGLLDTDAIEPLIGPSTRAICITHASNICGSLLPARAVGDIARRHGLFFILDTAQTAGFWDIDMAELGVDALAFTGHKGLLGPQGIGGMILSHALAEALTPLITGGTGSMSDSEAVPAALPDRFEPGTPNLPGIYGLHAALGYIADTGLRAIRQREVELARRLEAGLMGLPGVRLIGPPGWEARAPIVSVDCAGHDNALVSHRLAEEHRVLTRCGLHCAPAGHRALGTFPQGTVRFSPSHHTGEADIDAAVAAMAAILGGA